MKPFWYLLIMLLIPPGISAQPYPLEIDSLAPGVWRHVSYQDFYGAPFPSNGLIVATSEGVALIDTPWNAANMPELLRWIAATLRQPIAFALITHAHDDRLAGIDTLKAMAVPVYASRETIHRAIEKGLPVPSQAIAADTTLQLGNSSFWFNFPGAGHTRDNQVVYLPASKLLFAGCFSKSADATGLGNIADADLQQWPLSVNKALATFGEAEIVLPGHGAADGLACLRNTCRLLNQE